MVDRFIGLVDGWKLLTIVILIGLDVLAGIIIAFKEGTFSWQKLPSFLRTDVIYMFGGYLLVGIWATIDPSLEVTVVATFGLLLAGLGSGILGKLKKLGIPIPEVLTR